MAIMMGIPSTVIRAAEPLSAITSPRIVAFRRRVGPRGSATDEAQFEFGTQRSRGMSSGGALLATTVRPGGCERV
jgi:hypothetical protein